MNLDFSHDAAFRKEQRQAVIRPGQRKAYAKGTHKQIDLRIEAAALLQDIGCSKSEIHRIFRQRYGVEWRQTDRYLARARAGMAPGFPCPTDTQPV